jgi:hypothetical protein
MEVFARRIPPARQPYWVNEWENNPQGRSSLSHISQITKNQVRELVGEIIPPLATPWNQVQLMDGTQGLDVGQPMVGAVVGSVQSGKTASMVGLISHLYDIGYDAVVVLTGRTNDLNLQTAIRLKNDVFDWGEDILRGRNRVRCTSPMGDGSHKIDEIFNNVNFYSTPVKLGTGNDWDGWYTPARTSLSRLKPSLFVSKKTAGQHGSILRMERTMESLNQHCNNEHGRSLRWAIIDDECDSLTVGHATAVTPMQLYNTTTIGECVYIGYSATPQANLFAVEGNPLFPEHFCFFLRTGHYWEGTDPHPRLELCYQVDSINKMYCGEWVFHNFCDAVGINNFVQEDTPLYTNFAQENMIKPLMHYLVTGGARWLLGGELPFLQGDQPLGTDFPSPHTMLINPHDHTVGHRIAAQWLINALRSSAGLQPETIVSSEDWKNRGQRLWDNARAHIPLFLQNNQAILEEVYNEISDSYAGVEGIRGRNPNHVARQFPDIVSVVDAVENISGEIKLKILNGNHRDDEDRIDYDERGENNTVTMAEDVYTIAIGGKKLGRGITLSGLCTTLFLTSSGRADDSAVQMQRWFGYRGSHLEFVKVFCPNTKWRSRAPDNYEGLRERNENLQDIYELICMNWGARIPPDINNPNWSVLIGQSTNPSNRVPQRKTFPGFTNLSIINYIHPSSVNAGVSQSNLGVINRLYNQMVQKGMPQTLWVHPRRNTAIGLFCGIPFDGDAHQNGNAHGKRFTANEIADFLDALQWPNHNPSNAPIRHPYQIPQDRIPSDFIYRQPAGPVSENLPKSKDPYLIAAYLRMWDTAYTDNTTRVANGTLVDLPADHITHAVTTPPPEFNVIIRNGGSTTAHNFASGVEIKCRRFTNDINQYTGALSGFTWVSAEKRPDYGTDKRADDIRRLWSEGNDWNTSRNALRSGSDGDPGMIMISLIDDGNGNIAPVIHYSIPDGGLPVVRYI